MMTPKKSGPRAEHRLREEQRVKDSLTLAAKYPQLKSLTADLAYCDHEQATRCTTTKYRFNLEVAKSVFRFECQNLACAGGDFDLSRELANAIAARRAIVIGQLSCQGWRDNTTIAREHCHYVLRYKLRLSFVRRRNRLADYQLVTHRKGPF